MAATKHAPTKKAAKKVPARRAAAKKSAVANPEVVADTGAAGFSTDIAVGSIVMFTSNGETVGPGRLCALKGIGNACVMFGDGIGCQQVAADLLSLAPPGSTAPPCDGCEDC